MATKDDWYAQFGGGLGPAPNAMTPSVGPAGTQPTFPGYDPTNQGAQHGQGWSVGAAQPSLGMGSGMYGYVPLSAFAQGGLAGAALRGGPQGGLPGAGAAAFGRARPVGGGMVWLRAPNGQTRAVPADQVAHYLARGAVQV